MDLASRPDTDRSASLGRGQIVRCDDLVPPDGDSDALGAFLLCWSLDAPHARLSVGGPGAAAAIEAATSLGCGAIAAGAPPAVALCAGRGPTVPSLLIDALAAGIPIVGRRTPALEAVVGDAGLLVDPGDGTAVLASALAAVLADGDLAADLARRGRARLAEVDPGAGKR